MICMDNLTDYFALVSNVHQERGRGCREGRRLHIAIGLASLVINCLGNVAGLIEAITEEIAALLPSKSHEMKRKEFAGKYDKKLGISKLKI